MTTAMCYMDSVKRITNVFNKPRKCNKCPVNTYSSGGKNAKCLKCPKDKPVTNGKIGMDVCSPLLCPQVRVLNGSHHAPPVFVYRLRETLTTVSKWLFITGKMVSSPIRYS